jgi:hypothetical protein
MLDWKVPAYLFRFHLVEFQQLGMMDQTDAPAGLRSGRTGDDCLAFRCNVEGNIVATLFCDAKCTADHDTELINDSHEKSSLGNLVPVDILQVVEVLADSADPDAPSWIDALRELYLKGPTSGYERFDQVTYVCGRSPTAKDHNSWIPIQAPHPKYTGNRKLHVAEVHLLRVEEK